MKKQNRVRVQTVIRETVLRSAGWSLLLLVLAVGAIVSALLPPLLLEQIIDRLSTEGADGSVSLKLALHT